MNIFLTQPDIAASCRELAAADPVRARKQFIEACQVLASAERNITGMTGLRKKDGSFYKHTHPHHPITMLVGVSRAMFDLTHQVALQLAVVYPNHACAASIKSWYPQARPESGTSLVVCRLGLPTFITHSLDEYAALLRGYLISKKGVPLDTHAA